jgi:hypothetical protein
MEPKKKINPMGPAIAVGVGIGTALGLAMDNLALGIGIGVAVGTALGAGLYQKAKTKAARSNRCLLHATYFLVVSIGRFSNRLHSCIDPSYSFML